MITLEHQIHNERYKKTRGDGYNLESMGYVEVLLDYMMDRSNGIGQILWVWLAVWLPSYHSNEQEETPNMSKQQYTKG